MAWTQTDLDAIKTAIKSGTLSVEFADRKVTYRSLDEMTKILDMIEREVGTKPKRTVVKTSHSKGV